MRKGILLLGGSGKRFLPATALINKHLIPIINKPIFYYSLSCLMLCGIKKINIISNSITIKLIKKLIGSGKNLGLNIKYTIQSKPNGIAEGIMLSKKFIGKSNFALMLGDNFFYAENLPDIFTKISSLNENTVIAYKVKEPSQFGVLKIKKNKIIEIIEKPKKYVSDLAVTGLYFYQNNITNYLKYLKPSKRKELEITDLNNLIIKNNNLNYRLLGRGFVWLDSGTPKDHHKTSEFVRIIEERTGKKIAMLDEIAFRKKFINSKQFMQNINKTINENEREYLNNILKEKLSGK